MRGHVYKPNCKCPKGKKCVCGSKWGYLVDVGVDPRTGKRKQKFKGGFSTKKEASNALDAFKVEVNQSGFQNETDETFESFAKVWLNLYSSTGKVKVSTIRVRDHESRKLIHYIGKMKLKKITPKIYQDALNNLLKDGLAENTISGINSTGKMIFSKALELQLIKKDPTQFAYHPKKQKTVEELENENEIPKFLEKEDLAKFLKIAEEFGLPYDTTIFLVLSYTGMRVGEMCALKWSDVDFKNNTIKITKTYYNPSNNTKQYYLLTPKTKSSKRIIDIDDFLAGELKKHQINQKIEKMRLRDQYHNENFIFSIDYGKAPGYPMYPKQIITRMRRLLKIAELDENLSPHSFRHTHTSLLAEAGVGLEEIMARLGHSDDSITRNVYLHITKSKRKEAAHKFSELMSNFR